MSVAIAHVCPQRSSSRTFTSNAIQCQALYGSIPFYTRALLHTLTITRAHKPFYKSCGDAVRVSQLIEPRDMSLWNSMSVNEYHSHMASRLGWMHAYGFV